MTKQLKVLELFAGTQGLKGSVERSKIPEELCQHIVDISQMMLIGNTEK